MKRFIVRAAAVALVSAGLASPALAEQGERRIGRCHMGGCTWFRIDEAATVRTGAGGTLRRASVRWGSSSHPDFNMPRENGRNVRIEWEAQPAETYAYCTPRSPALIQREEDGSWQATRMDLVGTAGAMESAATLYAAICHPGENWRGDGFAARHGYRAVEDADFFFPLERPEDILTRGD